MAVNYLGRLTRLRRVSQADLQAGETTVLKAGEPVYVTETGEIRVGDGVTSVLNLPSTRNRSIRTVTGATTAVRSDDLIIVNAAGATNTTLPVAAGNTGRTITVKNIGAGAASVVVSGGGNIDGAATNTAPNTQYAFGRYFSNGTQWYTV